jgi:hypothetical protein
MAVQVKTDTPTFESGATKALFEIHILMKEA